jgi:hypothetical protein
MAVTVTVAGSAAQAVPLASAQPPPGAKSLQVPVTVVTGDWMVALVTWRQAAGAPAVTVSVQDDPRAHNWWEPLGQPSGTSGATGITRTAIWVAPAAKAANYVLVAPTGVVQGLACIVLDIAGMSKWQTLAGLSTTWANAASALSALALGAPASQAIVITGCGSDNNADTITLTGAGWTSVSPVSASNGVSHTTDITLSGAYQVTTGATSATWSSSGSQDLSGIIAGLLVVVAAPVQPNLNWPVVMAELAIGAGPGTPPDQLTWTQVNARSLSLTGVTQGKQYNLGALAAGTGVATWDNPDGALIPPGTGSFAGIDSGTPYRLRMIWPASATPYGVPFSGFIRKWPQQWNTETLRGYSAAAVADAWAYCNGQAQPILQTEILNDIAAAPGLCWYWPCTDAPLSTAAGNAAPGNLNPLVAVQSKYGNGGATQAFGQNASAILGAQGTVLITSSVRAQAQSGMWGLLMPSGSNLSQGMSLACTDQNFPLVTGGVSIEAWFQAQAPFNLIQLARVLSVLTVRGFEADIFLDPATGHLLLDAGGPHATSTVTLSTVNYLAATGTGLPGPLAHVALTFTRTTYTAYVNGAQAATGSWSTSLSPKFSCVSFDGIFGTPAEATLASVSGNQYSGFTGHALILPGILTAERVNTHYQAGQHAMAGDTADARIERLLQAGAYLGRRVILQDAGIDVTPMVSCQDIAGQPVSASIGNIAASTPPAVMAVAPAGHLFYLSRGHAWAQGVKWVLGENAGAGEIPYLDNFGTDYDPLRIVNDAQYTGLDDQSVTTASGAVAAAEPASIAQYGDQSVQATSYLQNDALSVLTAGPGTQDLANWAAGTSAKPGSRIVGVTVDAAAYPLAWPLFMTIAVGDMITVNRRPPTSSVVLSVTGRVSQTSRDISFDISDGVKGSVQLLIDIAPEATPLTADDASLGQLTGQNVLAW